MWAEYAPGAADPSLVGPVAERGPVVLEERRAVGRAEARCTAAALELDDDRSGERAEIGHRDLRALRLHADRRAAVGEPLLERDALRARRGAIGVLVREARRLRGPARPSAARAAVRRVDAGEERAGVVQAERVVVAAERITVVGERRRLPLGPLPGDLVPRVRHLVLHPQR